MFSGLSFISRNALNLEIESLSQIVTISLPLEIHSDIRIALRDLFTTMASNISLLAHRPVIPMMRLKLEKDLRKTTITNTILHQGAMLNGVAFHESC